jgi:hypothetical protein
MKTIIIFLFVILTGSLVYSQEVGNVYDLNCYKYVVIHDSNYTDVKYIKHESIRIIRNLFLKKKFKVYTLRDNLNKAPDDFKIDTCIILHCYLELWEKGDNLNNTARITLRNCNDEIIYENTASSLFGGTEGALENAFEPITNMKYEYDPKRKIH